MEREQNPIQAKIAVCEARIKEQQTKFMAHMLDDHSGAMRGRPAPGCHRCPEFQDNIYMLQATISSLAKRR